MIMVAKNLPFSIKKTERGEWIVRKIEEGNPLTGAERGLEEEGTFRNCIWVGGVSIADLSDKDRSDLTRIFLRKFNALPVFVNEPLWIQFCKRSLWPCLNSQLSTKNWDPEHWRAYKRTNTLFARAIIDSGILSPAPEDDLVWVQDYHLLLVPNKLRNFSVSCRVGLFIHTGWPTTEIFRILPMRGPILKGMLGADLIGVQTHNYAHYFLSACSRLLTADVSPTEVSYSGNTTKVGVFPVGIDLHYWQEIIKRPSVHQQAKKLKEMLKGKKIILGKDRLDSVMGIPEKLTAFADFFERFPEWQGKVILFQVCLPPSSFLVVPSDQTNSRAANTEDKDLRQLRATINELVGKINGKYSTADFTPIRYLDQGLNVEQLAALYLAADVLLITPLRDGMNLVGHEFEACRREPYGAQILSEFTGSALALPGAVLVNPWDVMEVSTAIDDALKMSETQRRLRHESNLNYVVKHTAYDWGKQFLDALGAVNMFTALPPLHTHEVISAFRQAKKRVLLFNYDGVLTPITKYYMDATPSSQLLKCLDVLSSKPKRNQVYIITGRDRLFMESFLGYLRVGMACEHGVFFRPCDKEQQWQHNIEDVSWKESIMPILQDFADRTPGSMIEEKEVNITWHYRNVDRDFASFQVNELLSHLQNVISKLPVDIVHYKKAIEIRPQNVNSGGVVRKILAMTPDADFVLCIGSDHTAEEMYSAVESFEPQIQEQATLVNRTTSDRFNGSSSSHSTDGSSPVEERRRSEQKSMQLAAHPLDTIYEGGTPVYYYSNSTVPTAAAVAEHRHRDAAPGDGRKDAAKLAEEKRNEMLRKFKQKKMQKETEKLKRKDLWDYVGSVQQHKAADGPQRSGESATADGGLTDDDAAAAAHRFVAPKRVFTCRVGKDDTNAAKPTAAKYYVRNPADVLAILKELRQITMDEALEKYQQIRKARGRRCMSAPHIALDTF